MIYIGEILVILSKIKVLVVEIMEFLMVVLVNMVKSEVKFVEQVIFVVLIFVSEKDLLVCLVEVEVKGEFYEGKVGVVIVVLNCVDFLKFSDMVIGVIK